MKTFAASKSENDRAVFLRCAQHIFPGFKVDSENQPVIDSLLLYFSGNPAYEDLQPGYSLNKGILLAGPTGTGKTSLMKVFQFMFQNGVFRNEDGSRKKNGYGVVSMLDLVLKYQENDISALRERQGNVCFDEIGLANEHLMHYGSRVNVGQTLLLLRYNLFQDKGVFSHFTTNSELRELGKFYGPQVASRLKEMVNFHVLTSEKDRRENSTPFQKPQPKDKPVNEAEENKKALVREILSFYDFLKNNGGYKKGYGEHNLRAAAGFVFFWQANILRVPNEEVEKAKLSAESFYAKYTGNDENRPTLSKPVELQVRVYATMKKKSFEKALKDMYAMGLLFFGAFKNFTAQDFAAHVNKRLNFTIETLIPATNVKS